MNSVNIVFPERERIAVIEEPVATPGPDEVLCEARRSLISTGTEMICLKGEMDPGTNWSEWIRFPFHPGYGMAARVLEVGRDVEAVKPGDRVAVAAQHRQRFTFPPVIRENRVPRMSQWAPIPADVTDEDATWMSLACTTQVGVRRADLKLGETVGVVGAGILGQLVTQYLRVAGARRIVVIDPVAMRLEMAKAHGATDVLPVAVTEAADRVRDLTGGRMLDVVFDITGHAAVFPVATTLVRRMGRVVLLGDSPTPSRQALGPRIVSNSITIFGAHSTAVPAVESEFAPWTNQEMTALFFDFLRQKRMSVSSLVTHRHSPAEAPAVYAALLKDRSTAAGVIFDWSRIG